VNAGEDTCVNRVVLHLGGNVVVPRDSRRDGREGQINPAVGIQL
jgi:hypothetical protein